MLTNPQDVFKFLFKNKMCQKHALFYAAWALVAETEGNFKNADKIYTKGIEM
jgi:hypothetical protein